MIPLDFLLGLSIGLAVAAATYVGFWWWARRTGTQDASPTGPPDPLPSRPMAPEPSTDPGEFPSRPPDGTHPTVDPLVQARPPGDSPEEAGRMQAPEDPAGGRVVTEVSRSKAPVEAIRLSHRVILHVYAQGNLPPGAVAPLGLCQAGIGDALGISQGGLAAVLRRLEAAGILTTERGHVQGRDRRLKVYRLSARGLELAKELRTRARRPPTVRSGPTNTR